MDLDPVPTTRVRQLKAATTALHAEAERHVRILDADAGVSTYRRYLERMYGYHAPLEDCLAAHPELEAAGFVARTRRKQGLLRADLAALGVRAADLPRCPTPTAIDGLAAGTGVAYVLEQSTMSSRVHLARLPHGLRHLRGRATAFLDGYGAETGPRWTRFVALADAALAGDAALEAAIARARTTLTTLIAWLADAPAGDARFATSRAR
jgi:heme oxygenase